MHGEEQELWQAYERGQHAADRDKLLAYYTPWVDQMAAIIALKTGNGIDAHDLAQEGLIALLDRIRGFQSERGNIFKTYAMARIRGAMQDALRNQDWVPRLERKRFKQGSVETLIAVCSLDDVVFAHTDDDEHTRHDIVGRPCDGFKWIEDCEAIDELIRGWTRRERMMFLYYHIDGKTMKQIGELLGCSGSWVSHQLNYLWLRVRRKVQLRLSKEALKT